MNDLAIEIYGIAAKEICSGCESHGCSECAPGVKRRTLDLYNEFERLLAQSDFKDRARAAFFEITSENIARHEDVQKLLSMAELDPVIVINGKIAYLGGFSPEGLMEEMRKKGL